MNSLTEIVQQQTTGQIVGITQHTRITHALAAVGYQVKAGRLTCGHEVKRLLIHTDVSTSGHVEGVQRG